MKTTKEDMILPVRYYVPSAFSLNLYSNTIEQGVCVFFCVFFFSPPFIFSPPGYLVTFLVPAPVRLIIFSITVATRTVGADEQTTNFVMQDCLLITRILDFFKFYLYLHRHGGSFELCFVYLYICVGFETVLFVLKFKTPIF